MSALNSSGPTSPTPVAFPGFVPLSASLTSCNCHLPKSLLSHPLPRDSVCHACLIFHQSALAILWLLSWLCCIVPCFYYQWHFLLLQPCSLSNSSYPTLHSFSPPCSSHYTLFLCLSRSDLAPSIFSFASFLSLIFSRVFSPIPGLLCFLDLPITFFAASLYVAKIKSWQTKHDKSCLSSKSPIEFQELICVFGKSL